ncbi:MAG: hypothetical protein IH948_09780, partial [Bacteroidetes bacterium]|nr:hypothetical protein [Bacteroidota bacterium]
MGVISIIWKLIKKQLSLELRILVLSGFLVVFVAHSLFWYLGIFNSMGLPRVLVGVCPLIAIISLFGYNFITTEALRNKRTTRIGLQGLLIVYVLIFPVTSNPASIKWKSDFNLSIDQQTAMEVANFIRKNV